MALLTGRKLEYPFTCEKVRELKLGELVTISGHVFACRDRVHRYLFEDGPAPVALKDGAIFHCGPTAIRKDGAWLIRAAGPTTSIRTEPYMAGIIGKHQVRVIIGKGGMGDATRRACGEFGCVYLQAVGGAAQLLAARIERVEGVHLVDQFGPTEALWDFVVKDFPAIVSIDAFGRSLFRRIETASKAALRRISKAGVPFKG